MTRLYSGIYKITNTINNKCYIGSAIIVYKRIKQHKFALKGGYHHSKHLQRAWDKYGKDNFKFEKIINCLIENLLIMEQEMMIKYNSIAPFGYNICPTAGNTIGRIPSKETKEKIAISLTGKTQSEETRRKRSISMTGRKYTQEHRDRIGKASRGRIYSEETRLKRSISQKAVDRSGDKNVSKRPEVRYKISKSNTGKIRSEEVKEKISIIVTAHHLKFGHPCTGTHHSEETKKKQSEARKRYLLKQQLLYIV